MARGDDARRLRAEVQRKLKSVNNKIARIQRTSGANVSGTEFDPRRRAGIEKTYNARQLNTYLGQLSSFMRRTNQFVAGDQGPIPRGKFNLYKKAEAEYNEVGRQHFADMDNLIAPSGFSIKQSRNLVAETVSNPKFGPYTPLNRQPSYIKDAGALERLTADLNRKLKNNYLPSELEKSRGVLIDTLTKMGENEMIESVKGLSQYQFDVLWNGTNFAEGTFLKYKTEQARLTGKPKEAWQDKVIDDTFADMGELLDWAGSKGQYTKTGVPRERPTR